MHPAAALCAARPLRQQPRNVYCAVNLPVDFRLPAFLVDEDVVMHELAAAAETVYDEKPQPGRPPGARCLCLC